MMMDATNQYASSEQQHSATDSFPMDSWVRDGRESGPFAGEPTLLVVDPATRKLCIPVSAVMHTQALQRMDRVPSICMLYLQGRCRQGPACHQLHADPGVVDMLRAEVCQRTSCCPHHGEEVSQPSLQHVRPSVEAILVDGQRIPADRIATTNGVRRIAEDAAAADTAAAASKATAASGSTITVQRAQVCRLHVLGRCRYAEDCNFVHLCRAMCDGQDQTAAKLVAALAASTPNKAGRPTSMMGGSFRSGGFGHGTPNSAFVAQMPPSPLYGGAPRYGPSNPAEGFPSLDHNEDSNGTTPPGSPAYEPGSSSVTTPLTGPWRRDPYSWTCVSPVKASS